MNCKYSEMKGVFRCQGCISKTPGENPWKDIQDNAIYCDF